MRRTASNAVMLLALVTLAGPTFASNKYTIDPEHATVSFKIGHGKWSTYQGMVRKIAGKIFFDKENVEMSSVQVEMDAKSVDTLNFGRDYEVQSFGFLDVTKNPTIKFSSTSVERTGERRARLSEL